MTALRFPSGERLELGALPAVSSGCTTLAGGREGPQLQPGLAEPLPPMPAGMARMPSARLQWLARELGTLLDAEIAESKQEPWFDWAVDVERQALCELARRAL